MRACSADEILSAISAGEPLELTSRVIDEPVDLNGQTIRARLTLTRVEFGDKLDLSYARFDAPVSLIGCDFFDLNCDSAHFASDLTLNDSTFRGRANFRDARIDGAMTAKSITVKPATSFLSFNRARFGKTAALTGSIEREADFRHARVDGDAQFVDYAERRWSRFLESSHFDGFTVSGSLQMDHAEFEKSAVFTGVRIDGQGAFQHAQFGGRCTFDYATFGGAFRCDECRVAGPANFRGARFEQEFRCKAATFKGKVDATDAQFGSVAYFSTTEFQREATFERASFSADALFGADEDTGAIGVRFLGAASFKACEFKRPVSFAGVPPRDDSTVAADGALFLGKAAFEGARFDVSCALAGTSFADLDLRHSVFSGALDLSETKLRGHLELDRARLSALHLPTEEAKLPPRLSALGAACTTFSGDGVAAVCRLDGYQPTTIGALEAAARNAGDEKLADDIYVAGRKRQRSDARARHDWSVWTRNLLYGFVARWGARPWRLLVVPVVLVALAAMAFEQPRAALDSRDRPRNLSYGQALAESVDELVPVDLSVGKQWRQSQERVPIVTGLDRPRAEPYWVASALNLVGWILVPLGIAALSGLLRRQPRI